MKKLIAMLLTAALIVTMAMPAFADESNAAAKLAKVQELKVLKNGYKSLKLSWKPAEGAVKYQVYRSKTGKTGSFALKFTTKNTAYNNTAVTCGTTYYYKVRAVAADGTKGAFSSVVKNTVQPSTVKITKVNCIDEWKVRIYWNKVAGASGYQVYRSKKGADSWELYKTVVGKYNYATNYLEGDTKYTVWEWKVRAYRTVNGEKVYGYFSTPSEWQPDWTIDEIYEELWKYGESLKFPLYEYANPDGSDNENGEVIVPKTDGSTYNLRHIVGWIDEDNIWGDEAYIYTNSQYGNTIIPANFIKCTPENMSWTVAWLERVSYYDTKESLLKRLKPALKSDLKGHHEANPVYWANAYIEGVGGPNDEDEYWNGVQDFSIYIEKDRNGYKIWSLW